MSHTNTRRVIPAAVQLWSVRGSLAGDFDGTLTALSEMGFNGVEFAGDYGPYAGQPEQLKGLLHSLDLQVAGAHVGVELLRGDSLLQTIAFHSMLGTPFIIVPYDRRAFDVHGVFELAHDLDTLDERLAAEGLRIGYHNHAPEMSAFGELTFWDVLAQNTRDSVILQLDVGWATFAGKDPAEYVRRYPGRTATIHYKVTPSREASTHKPFVGLGPTDWKALLQTNLEVGCTQWLVVEQENYPNGMTPLQCVASSLKGLDGVLTG